MRLLKSKYQNIPPELRSLPHWVNFKNGKKIPLNPQNLENAQSDNPATWDSFEKAAVNCRNGIGLGFVFAENDPFTGTDLDKCIDPLTGKIEAWALRIINTIGSYTEISPSGTGVHIITKSKLPPGSRKVGRIECYDSGRFFTFTSNTLKGSVTIREFDGTELHKLLMDAAQDLKIIDKAIASKNGEVFKRLWDGDITGYPSQSEADMALAGILYFWTKDKEATDRLFRKSGLYRGKWDEKHFSNGKTYGEALIDKVAESASEVSIGSNTVKDSLKVNEGNEVNVADRIIKPIPYPIEVFPEKFKRLVRAVSKSFSIQESLAASIMLAVLSGAIGNSLRVSVRRGYEVVIFLWLMVIGKTGYCKTPPFEYLLQPVNTRQAENSEKNEEALRLYFRQLRKSRNDPLAEIPEKPKLTHNFVSDTTVESLIDVYYDDNRGVISYQDELASLVLGLDQYKVRGNDLQQYLKIWYGTSLKNDRKGVSRFVRNTGIGLMGGIQPEMVPRIFESVTIANGFFPRFEIEIIQGAPGKFDRDGIDPSMTQLWHSLIHKCYELPIKTDDKGFVNPIVLTFEKEAREEWIAFHDEWASLIPYMSDRLGPFIEKLKGYYSLKFSGILHVLKSFLDNKDPEGLIDIETVRGAIALTRYHAGQSSLALNLYDESGRLTEYQIRLIQTLYQLQTEVDNGQLLFSRIVDIFNSGLPEALKHTPEKIAGLVRGLNLKTIHGSQNIVYLVWEKLRLENLFLRITLTSLTTLTEEDIKNENLPETEDIVDEWDNDSKAKPVSFDVSSCTLSPAPYGICNRFDMKLGADNVLWPFCLKGKCFCPYSTNAKGVVRDMNVTEQKKAVQRRRL